MTRSTSVAPSAPRSAWKWFLALEACLALVYCPFGIPPQRPFIFGFLPWMEWPGQVPAWSLLGLSAVAAIVYGVRRNRPHAPMAWWFVGAGVLLFITGDTTYKFWHQIIGQQSIPFPSFIDAIYIAMYPVLAIGLLLLARARVPGGDRASLIDAVTVTLGVWLVSWTFLIGPNFRGSGDLLVRLTATAYPLGDVLLLAMLAHLWSAGGFHNPAGRLLAIGTVGALAADSIYGLANLHPAWNWSDGNPVDLGWIVFYACWGAAALHPSMRELGEPRPAGRPRTTRSRLMLLAAVSLIGPALLLGESMFGNPIDAPMVAVVAGAMFLCVLLRMAGLVWEREQAEVREQFLRQSASELSAASSREDIYRATISGLADLVVGIDDVHLVVAALSPEGHVVAVEEAGAPLGAPLDLEALWTSSMESMTADGKDVPIENEQPSPSAARDAHSDLVVCSLVLQERLSGLIVVESALKLPFELRSCVETLSAQVGLALDRELMTEVVHARRSEARFQTLVQSASDVILIVRPDTTISYQTPSVRRTLGYEPADLEDREFTSLLHPDDLEKALAVYTGVAFRAGTSVTAEWRIRHADGKWHNVEVVATNLLDDPTVEGCVLTMRDVSERKVLEEELKHQAFHDALSGLANRALFHDRLEQALARAVRSSTSVAVLFLDLDDFKLVNDSLGHTAGDQMLAEVAVRINGSLRAGDTAARFGGDEFAVLVEQCNGIEEACEVAERIIADLYQKMLIDDREFHTRASIGIALSPRGAESPADLIQAADVAMYSAKARGKGSYEVYQPSLRLAMLERLEQTADLQRAVANQEFVLHYQPIVSIDGSDGIGLEALVRWNHPERGILLPQEFIPLAEETGLIVPLSRWILHEACFHARLWQHQHDLVRLRMSVNISVRHFQDDNFINDIATALSATGFDPNCLVLEITENVLIKDAESVIERMLELRAMGVKFAIDDFGTGYSSLSYIKRFPIDILKIDKSFVDGVIEDQALAEVIVQLGRTLNLQTVAEGIEQALQVETLRSFGCQFGQGFYLSRPLPGNKVGDFLAALDPADPSSVRQAVEQTVVG
jgi:diguanylate cyclase (GGDEF)-like protein/PAS domain S-box-containing protein